MSIQILKKEIPSTDKIHTLRGVLFLPEGEIKAVLQISHGMVEHIGRYKPFMTYLAENGFAVFGHDHIGHGATAENDEELGYFAEKDGWKTVIDDVHAFGSAVMQEFPGKKHFLLGTAWVPSLQETPPQNIRRISTPSSLWTPADRIPPRTSVFSLPPL